MENKNIIILSIESSGSVCSICLSIDNDIISEYNIFRKNTHDKLLAESIRTILKYNDYKLSDIDAVAISSGPGSFTGLRIGFAIAKGICYDNQIKLIAIPTLKAIAYEQSEIAKYLNFEFILPVIQSNEDFFYNQIFNLELNALTDVNISKSSEILEKNNSKTLIAGPSAKIINPDTPEIYTKLTATTISKLAYRYYKESLFSEPSSLTPDYYQKFKVK